MLPKIILFTGGLKHIFFLAPLHGFECWMTSILLMEWLSISCTMWVKMSFAENYKMIWLLVLQRVSGEIELIANWLGLKRFYVEKSGFIQRILMNHSFASFSGHCTVVAITHSHESPPLLRTCIIWHSFHQLKWGKSTKLGYHLGKKNLTGDLMIHLMFLKSIYAERKGSSLLFIVKKVITLEFVLILPQLTLGNSTNLTFWENWRKNYLYTPLYH